jgi:signal transduction histidine kinase
MTEPGARGVASLSLRRRITIATIAVFAVVLVVTLAAVYTSFTLASNRSMNTLLSQQVQLANQLAARNTPPAELVEQLDTRSVSAYLELADGQTFGSPRRRVGLGAGSRAKQVHFPDAGGPLRDAKLTIQVDDRPLVGARSRLARVLLIVAMAALAAIAVLVPLVARVALTPLDSMTAVARAITGGRRGQRFRPHDQNTELGRTAAAFDEMLDALEGAERRALASEERMRRFVADAAHELRTPVTGIAAAAEAVLQQPMDVDPTDRERLLLVLGAEARRAGRLVDDLLDVARIDAGLSLHRAPADLWTLANAQAERVRVTHPAATICVEGGPAAVNVDAARIGQVIANLLNNACAVTSPGGSVRISVAAAGETATLVVGDDGPGVSPEDRERIFGRLVHASRSGGSGLGLTIARGIARAHGGDVVCVGPPPGSTGAVFVLRLPLLR